MPTVVESGNIDRRRVMECPKTAWNGLFSRLWETGDAERRAVCRAKGGAGFCAALEIFGTIRSPFPPAGRPNVPARNGMRRAEKDLSLDIPFWKELSWCLGRPCTGQYAVPSTEKTFTRGHRSARGSHGEGPQRRAGAEKVPNTRGAKNGAGYERRRAARGFISRFPRMSC